MQSLFLSRKIADVRFRAVTRRHGDEPTAGLVHFGLKGGLLGHVKNMRPESIPFQPRTLAQPLPENRQRGFLCRGQAAPALEAFAGAARLRREPDPDRHRLYKRDLPPWFGGLFSE
jgi:hypothetical protein